jgi:hypothetical protein
VAVRSRVPSICPRFPVLSFWSPQVAPIQVVRNRTLSAAPVGRRP